MTSGCGSVWLERCLREAEVASSNLVTPTKKTKDNILGFLFIVLINCSYVIVIFKSPPIAPVSISPVVRFFSCFNAQS